MKTLFVRDCLEGPHLDRQITLLGWLRGRRVHKHHAFLDLSDSTGTIQVVVNARRDNQLFNQGASIPLESALKVEGTLITGFVKGKGVREILPASFEIIGEASLPLSPRPGESFDLFDEARADHLLRNRHLYLRNDHQAAILKFRHRIMHAIRIWFVENGYTEITAPTLTPLPLYTDGSALSLEIDSQQVFLTQCVGFYLESAVHALERVYNMGPSFRGEESRSKRHLMEYWHIKAELAFVSRDDLMHIVEELLQFVARFCQESCADIYQVLGTKPCLDALATPFPRISYREALARLREEHGVVLEFGKSLGTEEEALLSEKFHSPFWVVGIPRSIEPFPYVIDPSDPELTMTADLIASRGYGELLGIAEKIHTLDMLDERMKEKGKTGTDYDWLRELRQYGCVPHGGFGMGVERLLRWLLQIPHVRDTMPFPRIFRRNIRP